MYPSIARPPIRRLACPTFRRAASDNRASTKLFADAAAEEAAAVAPRVPQAVRDAENWTGDERVEDAVLRMLVDKYRPLRTGSIRSAEEKLRAAPPAVAGVDHQASAGLGDIVSDARESLDRAGPSHASSTSPIVASAHYSADTPLIPAVEGHRPWLTTFKVPSHATSSVKYGAIPAKKKAASPLHELDDKARRRARDEAKKMQTGVRLTQARELTIDYKLGVRGKAQVGKLNPGSMKGWAGLVEDRIEVRVIGLAKGKWTLIVCGSASEAGRTFQQCQGPRKAARAHGGRG
jgi:DnaJ family protein C protein 28